MNMTAHRYAPLPGEPSLKQLTDRMIRVDQAGEYGAMRIYAGQLAVLKDKAACAVMQHMADQEQRHLDRFNQLIVERRVRPTLLTPLWHVAGFALGAATAMLGKEAAMACTQAVEEVIDGHYAAQQAKLPESERELADTIEQFRKEEIEHRDIAVEEGARHAPLYPLLHGFVTRSTKLAIWLSERI